MAFIELNDIVKVFKDRKRGTDMLAIDHVSLRLEKKEFLCLLGPSGCGKSTLLNMIAGFEFPTSGVVTVAGKPITGPGADRGMVFQQANLMPWLPVWDNVAFSLKLQGKSAAERRAAAQPFIETVKLKGFENHYPSELSGGMAQRVGIARALLQNPSVILMDEPFAALDAQTKMVLQQDLAKMLYEKRKTALFITHDLVEAIALSDRLLVMSERPGTIVEEIEVNLPFRDNPLERRKLPEIGPLQGRLMELLKVGKETAELH